MHNNDELPQAAGANVEVGITEVMQQRAELQSRLTAAVADISDRGRAMHLILSHVPMDVLEEINVEILRAPEHREDGSDSNLVRHARSELQRAGLFDADADYGGMIAEAVVELMHHFAAQGHSGESAMMTLDLFDKLAHYNVLTPLTSDPEEWMEVSEHAPPDQRPVWQSRRKSSCFSNDGGKTWYDIDPAVPTELERALHQKDVAYFERNLVVLALTKLFPAGIARTEIEGWDPEWFGCVYIDLPTGQVSWHYHDTQAKLFEHLPAYEKPWDGHTTEEKYDVRLKNLTAHPDTQRLDWWEHYIYHRASMVGVDLSSFERQVERKGLRQTIDDVKLQTETPAQAKPN
jgi:hypothetical protein